MRKLIAILLLPLFCHADDTVTVQNAVATGTLAKGNYFISSTITVNHSFNGNGSTINYTPTTGYAFQTTAANIKIQKFNFVGPNSTTNASGASAINIGNYDHDTISFCHVTTFPGYGILGGNGQYETILDCNIAATGYIGMFLVSSVAIHGGEVARDTIDRSMISGTQGSGVAQGALLIRGASGAASTYWNVHDCRLLMMSNPTDISCECYEHRYADHSTIKNMYCSGGSIGISIVRNNYVTIGGTSNTFTGQNNEAIEYADSNNGKASNCTCTSQTGMDVLLDGAVGALSDTLNNVSGNGQNSYCVQINTGSNSTVFQNCNFTSTAAKPSIEVIQASGIVMTGTTLAGSSTGNYAFELNNSTGNINVVSSTITNFTAKLFHYTTSTAVTANNITFKGMTYSGVTLSQDIYGPYTLGSNIYYNLPLSSGGLLIIGGKLYLKH